MKSNRRRTKIIATLGPACEDNAILERVIKAGANCIRLNCSHSEGEVLLQRAEKIRTAEKNSGEPLALLLDLQGPKLRLGSHFPKRDVSADERVTFVVGEEPLEGEIPVAFPNFLDLIETGSEIVIGDGSPKMRVLSVEEERVRTTVTHPGTLSARKGVSVTHSKIDHPALTEKDLRDLDSAIQIQPEFIALSFVRSADDVLALKQEMQNRGIDSRIISKIEKVEAYENLDEIMQESDGIMIARGDYGVEAGHTNVPLMQKDSLRRAGQAGKISITATHMLESMNSATSPTRAETADVANATLDGSSALMLSSETAVGKYPELAVATMNDIVRQAEKEEDMYCLWLEGEDLKANPATAVMHAAVTLGRDTDAEAIIVPTVSGGSVRAAAKYRPKRPIVALAHEAKVARELVLEWGVYPGILEPIEDIEDLIAASINASKKILPEITSEKTLILAFGSSSGKRGGTNIITLRKS